MLSLFKRKQFGIVVILLFIILLIGNFLIFGTRYLDLETKYAYIDYDIGYHFEEYLTSMYNRIESISAFYESTGQIDYDSFDSLAKKIYDFDDGFIAIQLKDNMTVTRKVYPIKGNENTLGKSLLDRPKVLQATLDSIYDGGTTINAPYELVQGELGTAIRSPIFIDGEFAGFVVGVVSLQDLIEKVDFDKFDEGIHYRLFFDGKLFFQSGQKRFLDRDFTSTYFFVGHDWKITFSIPWHCFVFDRLLIVALSLWNSLIITVLYVGLKSKKHYLSNKKYFKCEINKRTDNLVKINKELEEAKSRLEVSLSEKNILMSEIHHRVKNNMQIIISILDLQLCSIKNKKYVDLLGDIKNRVRSMALIHEELYGAKNFISVNFKSYVSNLVYMLIRSQRSNHVLNLELNLDEVSIDLNKAIPCGLILNELVSNSLKHAFKGRKNGKLIISLKHDDKYELIVRDDGVGLPKGIDLNNTKSLGMQIVHALVSQMDGNLEVVSRNGTMFKITFK